jgi:hypothetical protein
MIEEFLRLLAEATARIRPIYFQLPIAGVEDPIYRERVVRSEPHACRIRLER